VVVIPDLLLSFRTWSRESIRLKTAFNSRKTLETRSGVGLVVGPFPELGFLGSIFPGNFGLPGEIPTKKVSTIWLFKRPGEELPWNSKGSFSKKVNPGNFGNSLTNFKTFYWNLNF